MIKDDLFGEGLGIRREMFGPSHSDEELRNASEFTDKFQEIVTRYCYGDIWNRPGLGRRDRSLVTLAFLVALGRPQELEFHLEGALVNGVTAEEVRELLLQAVFYCGLPAVSEGFRVAHGVVASPPSDASA